METKRHLTKQHKQRIRKAKLRYFMNETEEQREARIRRHKEWWETHIIK